MPGSKPGERRGGRQKGAKNKATIERELKAAQSFIAKRQAPGTDEIELAVQALERAMKLAEGAASLHRPPSPAQIEAAAAQGTVLAAGDWDLFGEWFDRWTFCMKALAPYQSPQLKAVMVSMPANPQQPKVIEHERKPADAAERLKRASGTYLTLIKGGRAAAA